MKALITGANGGIGHAILQYLLSENYETHVLDVSFDQIENHFKIKKKRLDFCQIESIEKGLIQFIEPYDVVIHTSGIREIISIASLSLKEWQSVLNVNLTSAFIISQHVIKLSIQHSHPLIIIYVSSISGLYGEPERSAYCASKHGLIGLAKSLALELADHQIRVNTIAPGIIETNLTRPYQSNPHTMQLIEKNIPLKKWGQPSHIVQTVDFIIKNEYLTGSTVVVDGGWTAGKKF
jgi:NAD(P)-dependent dehydrogenase (short-subunit alcohol dehydrogenase family)